jgi:hypothetical protein
MLCNFCKSSLLKIRANNGILFECTNCLVDIRYFFDFDRTPLWTSFYEKEEKIKHTYRYMIVLDYEYNRTNIWSDDYRTGDCVVSHYPLLRIPFIMNINPDNFYSKLKTILLFH